MTQLELLADVAAALDDLRIAWTLVGSYASAAHGRPRTTHDIDVVAQLRAEHIGPLQQLLGERYYLSQEALAQAVKHGTPANVLNPRSGDKLDLWPLQADPYQLAAFNRRKPVTLGGLAAFVQSAEDTILSKLQWLRQSQSERHYHDALGVAEVQHGKLDSDYMRRWAGELGLAADLQRLLAEAEESVGSG